MDFHLRPHLNPLNDPEEIEFTLQPINPADANRPDFKAFRQPPSQYAIHLRGISPAGLASIDTFQLVARYQVFVDRAHLIARRRKNQNFFRVMIAQAIGINVEILEFPPNTGAYKNAVHGKLSEDIYNAAIS